MPKRLLVIGAGPIGVEMAQAFARLGSAVTLFEAMHGLLPREDQDAAEVVRKSIEKDNVEFLCCVDIERVERSGAISTVRFKSTHGAAGVKEFDAILVGVGLAGIGATIHPYPTQAEAVRKLGAVLKWSR